MGVKVPFGSPTVTYHEDYKYVRNPEWVARYNNFNTSTLAYTDSWGTLDVFNPALNTAVITYAMFPTKLCKLALMIDTVGSGNYYIDWGDGTVEQYLGSATVVREHLYTYANIPNPETSMGFKTVCVRILGDCTSIQLWRRPSGLSLADVYSNVLEIGINMPDLTDKKICCNANSTVERLLGNMITSIVVKDNKVTDAIYMFYGGSSSSNLLAYEALKILNISLPLATSLSNMFNSNVYMNSLQSLTINAPLATNLSDMLSRSIYMNSLQSLTINAPLATSLSQMLFNGIYMNSLQELTINAPLATSLNNMFASAVYMNSASNVSIIFKPSQANTSAFSGFTSSLSLPSCVEFLMPNWNTCTGLRTLYILNNQLSVTAYEALFNSAPDLTAVPATGHLYFTGGAHNGELTDEIKAIATNKGFTLHL